MRNKAVQMSLFDIYNGVLDSIEEKKPELITLLEEHIDFDRLIPCEFTSAFYGRMGSINAKLKMHKNANSKCTILAKHRLEEYTPLWRCEYERAKGHFREGEAFNERGF